MTASTASQARKGLRRLIFASLSRVLPIPLPIFATLPNESQDRIGLSNLRDERLELAYLYRKMDSGRSRLKTALDVLSSSKPFMM